MLTTVDINRSADPAMLSLLSCIGDRDGVYPTQISGLPGGYYESPHWSFDQVVSNKLNDYPVLDDPLGCYGVIDTPEQFHNKFGSLLQQDSRRFVVSFVEIRKDRQPPWGGWRWHKWGPYLGEQNPRYEYLYDEPGIDRVFTFHVYEVVECAACNGDQYLQPCNDCGVGT